MSSERPESAIPTSTPPSAATAAGPPDQGAPYPKRWKALAVLVVSLIIVVLDNTVLNVALKTIQDDLHATQDQLIWSINSYSLVFAALLFTWGVLGDRYGRRRILMIGLVLFALASALCAFAKSPEQLIAFRALMGIGGASVLPVTLSIITVIFPPQERGKAIGAWAAAVGGAVALGPLLGGFLLEHPEWFSSLIGNNFGSVFLINVPIIIAGLIGIVMVVPESKNPHPGRLDPVGLVLSVIGMLSLVYGIQEASKVGWTATSTFIFVFLGLAVLVGFVVFEARTDHPSLDLSLFQIRSFSVPLTGVSLAFAAMSGTLVFLAFYYQDVRGWSPLQSGALTLSFALGQVLAAPRSAKMVARFGARRVIPVGLILACIGMFLIAQIQVDSPVWYLLLFGFIFGTGLGNVMAPSTTRMTLATPPQRSGAGSAVQNTVRQLAAVLGVAILTSVEGTLYANKLLDKLSGTPVPDQLKTALSDSVGATYYISQSLEAKGTITAAQADALRQAGTQAFLPSIHAVAYIGLGMLIIALIVFILWLPAKAEAVSWHSGGGAAPVAATPGGRVEADGQPDARHQAHVVDEDPAHLAELADAPLELGTTASAVADSADRG